MSDREFIRECADMAMLWLNQAGEMIEWGKTPDEEYIAQILSQEIDRYLYEKGWRQTGKNIFAKTVERMLSAYNQDAITQSDPRDIVAVRIVKKVVVTYYVSTEDYIRSLAKKRRLYHPEIFNRSR